MWYILLSRKEWYFCLYMLYIVQRVQYWNKLWKTGIKKVPEVPNNPDHWIQTLLCRIKEIGLKIKGNFKDWRKSSLGKCSDPKCGLLFTIFFQAAQSQYMKSKNYLEQLKCSMISLSFNIWMNAVITMELFYSFH